MSPRQLWPFPSDCAILDAWPERSREGAMTTDAAAQLAILADALTEIVDLATADPKAVAPPAQVLARAGDLAAEALAVAAIHGPPPPCINAVDTARDGARFSIRQRHHDGALPAVSRLKPPRLSS
jgi:hypothetical protein